MTSDDQEQLASLDLVASYVDRQMDLQWQLWDSVDGRIRLLLGFVGAIFVATLALTDSSGDIITTARWCLIAAIVALALSGTIAFLAWLPRLFDRPPEPLTLRQQYITMQPTETRLAVLDTMVQAYVDNEHRINEKLNSFRRAAWRFGIAVVLIGVAGIIELVDADEDQSATQTEPAAASYATRSRIA